MPERDDPPSPDAASPTPDAVRPPAGRLLTRWILPLAASVIVVDQATKLWATESLAESGPITVLGDLLSLRLTYNSGAAFSIGTGFTWIFTIVTAIAAGAMVYAARRVRSRAWAVTLGLLLGGAVTHLLDRLFREPGVARGHVVDFIDYAGFFVGNVADISLVSGALLWVLLSVKGIRLDGSRTPDPDRTAS